MAYSRLRLNNFRVSAKTNREKKKLNQVIFVFHGSTFSTNKKKRRKTHQSFQYANFCADRRVKIRHVANVVKHTNTYTPDWFISVYLHQGWNAKPFLSTCKRLTTEKCLKIISSWQSHQYASIFFPFSLYSHTSLQGFSYTIFFMGWHTRDERVEWKKTTNCITQRIYIFIIPICMNHFFLSLSLLCCLSSSFPTFFACFGLICFSKGLIIQWTTFRSDCLLLPHFASFRTSHLFSASHRESIQINRKIDMNTLHISHDWRKTVFISCSFQYCDTDVNALANTNEKYFPKWFFHFVYFERHRWQQQPFSRFSFSFQFLGALLFTIICQDLHFSPKLLKSFVNHLFSPRHACSDKNQILYIVCFVLLVSVSSFFFSFSLFFRCFSVWIFFFLAFATRHDK